jgi:release factor glutamine methyltransferase
MKNSKTLFQDFASRITVPESNDEIQSMAYLVFEKLFGFSRTNILSEKMTPSQGQENKLEEIIQRINKQEPIQYILGEAAFYGRMFTVNPTVLIPRPETEELVRVVINFLRQTNNPKGQIIDVGTGSGCISITLSLELPDAKIFATDVSDGALQLANHNCLNRGAKVQFIKHDILRTALPGSADIIVSNPPYVTWGERSTMSANVSYEPELAVFVPSNDPLIFYKALLEKAKESLKPNGLLAVEINERYGKEVHQLFRDHELEEVQVLSDLFGKDRIVKGILSS